MTPLRFFACSLLSFFAASKLASADVKLPSIFSDHMVLQKLDKVPIWGTAAPGEHVAITLNGVKGETDAGSDGKWRVNLDLHDQAPGPYEMTVAAKNQLTVHDVLVGEVWLCGGQSNMELEVSRTIGAPAEIAASANPQIRLFQVKGKFALEPLDDCEGQWLIAGPSTTGAFTAVGYYFAKKVQGTLHVPVGLVSDNYGGSSIEAWMSYPTISQDPDLKATSDKLLDEAKAYPQALTDFQTQYQSWATQNQREDHPPADAAAFAGPDVSTADWKPVTLPCKFAQQGLPDSGIVWLRQTVEVPPVAAGSYLPIHLAGIHDFDTVYWNGVKVGSTTAEKTTSFNDGSASSLTRRYNVGGNLLKQGSAVLAIRIFSPGGHGGIDGPVNASGAKIGNQWLAKAESSLPDLSSAAQSGYPHEPPIPGGERNTATELYNGMLHPVIPYALRGFLWYQGESNTGRAVLYKTELPMLIKQWRDEWGEGDIPFYFCQLANFGGKRSTPTESASAEIRESMTDTLAVPNTGEAILIDIGEADDIHFRDKKDAGDRMAFLALANVYNQKIPFSGPVYDSSSVEGDQIRVKFKDTDGGLVAKALPATYQPKTLLPLTVPLVRNSPKSDVEGFQICGADHKWVWADAKIDGDSVLVSSPEVSSPAAVRYAWADNPTCNLYNGAGLPAGPFRTDDFPLTTAGRKY
jgi:sialate O-acetylesterase